MPTIDHQICGRLRVAVAVAVLIAIGGERASAQVDVFFQPANGNWFVAASWLEPNLQNMFVPSFEFNERAIVNNGGTAFVETSGGASPGAIILGSTAVGSGTLEVRNAGVLSTMAGTATDGSITVGNVGQGVVRVLPGGSLSSAGPLTLGANAANLISVGGAGAGTATLSAASATLNGTTQVFPNANFSTAGNLNLTDSSRYNVEVTAAGSGRINVGDIAQLNGTLALNFAAAPTIGSSWTVLEANTLNGAFDRIASSHSLPLGQSLVLATKPTGVNRQLLSVSLEEVLVLEVDRNTGVARMTQPGSGNLALDAYFIASGTGSLNPGGWNSFRDQGILGGDWIETRAAADNLGELKPTTAGTIAAGTSVSLGAVYNPFAGSFGQIGEDLQFVYTRPSDGAVINGIVTYTGTAINSLLLQVDPTTGETMLRNTSQTTVELDGYHVRSESDSLSTAGWNSLDEQNVGGNGNWLEVLNAGSGLLGEFNALSATSLAPGVSLSLGNAYEGDMTGMRDLTFEFLLSGEADGRIGTVIYEALSTRLDGDFNNNGVVDAADYVVWRETDGSPEGYNRWRANFGAVLPAAGQGARLAANSSVPEPSAWLLAAVAAGLLGLNRRS
jgi:hypothetical protein